MTLEKSKSYRRAERLGYGVVAILFGIVTAYLIYEGTLPGREERRIRQELTRRVPAGSPAAQALSALDALGLEHSSLINHTIDASKRNVGGLPPVHSDIFIVIRLDALDRVATFKVYQTLTGP